MIFYTFITYNIIKKGKCEIVLKLVSYLQRARYQSKVQILVTRELWKIDSNQTAIHFAQLCNDQSSNARWFLKIFLSLNTYIQCGYCKYISLGIFGSVAT